MPEVVVRPTGRPGPHREGTCMVARVRLEIDDFDRREWVSVGRRMVANTLVAFLVLRTM